MLIAVDVEVPASPSAAVCGGRGGGMKCEQVQRGEIARRIVEEHVFRARIRRDDRPRRGAGVPIVDRGVELQAGIGAGPGGVADLLPQFARLHRVGDLAGLGTPEQIPIAIGFDRFEKLVRYPHGIVGVLPGDGEVGLGIPIGVISREIEVGFALLGELDDAADVIVRHVVFARRLDLAAKHRILFRIEAIVAGAFAVHAGL